MRWVRHVARMMTLINTHEIVVFLHENKNLLGDLRVERRIILKWILEICGVRLCGDGIAVSHVDPLITHRVLQRVENFLTS